jgi:hypothetical protein
MEVERALADLAEVRDRLAGVQEFRGYSGTAAALSGLVAVAAGAVQFVIAPNPQTPEAIGRYLSIWFSCLALALIINYGALLAWYIRIAGRHERQQTRTAGRAIIPAIALGAVLSLAMIGHKMYGMLPGVWYASYGIGLFASRSMLPRVMVFVAAAFGVAGAALMLTLDPHLPLRFWVMPLGFGLGQMFIGYLLSQEKSVETVS